MATRTDLNMLQNLNRRLRTGLWQVPPQWKALRRVPGFSYSPSAVKRLTVPHQHLYQLIFERLPLLRLEGHRLGEVAVTQTGSSTAGKTITQRMVLRWWQLMKSEEPDQTRAFERVRAEFQPHLQQFAAYLTQTKKEAEERHSQLKVAKARRDALDIELGRPDRYAEHLENLVNRSLHRQPNEPHQYFSQTMSRKLIRQINDEKKFEKLSEKTEALRETLQQSSLGQRSEAIVQAAQPAAKPQFAYASASPYGEDSGAAPSTTPAAPVKRPITAFPVDASGEPVPSPELFYQVEKEWSTTTFNAQDRIGMSKDRRVTEFTRHIDEMVADPDATLADYLAYVLHVQIITLQSKSLQPWLPYTNYLNHRIFFHAYRLLQTAVRRSSVVIPSGYPILPKVRNVRLQQRQWTFQQAVTHQRLLVLVQNHLSVAPLHSFRASEEEEAESEVDEAEAKKRELPLTPFWQEVMDEKVRIKHPGESWYNLRIQEVIDMETEDQEYDRLEQEVKKRWLAARAAAAEGAQ